MPDLADSGRRPAGSMIHAIGSVVAIVVALIFFFPIYWSLSTSLRNPLDTFTVAGLGVPWLNFEPTLNSWIEQVRTPETVAALRNSTIIAVGAALLALLLGTPAAYALARFRFSVMPNKDLTVWFLSQRILPPVATVIPFYLVMRALGLLDTHLALILLNATRPSSTYRSSSRSRRWSTAPAIGAPSGASPCRWRRLRSLPPG